MNNSNTTYQYIEPNFEQSLMVTWDIGKRCNFDCAYCGADRHDNFSKFPDLSELKKGVLFLMEYFNLILPLKKNKNASINVTGGEPTANPAFLEFITFLNNSFVNFPFNININLTTNGSFNKKNLEKISNNTNGITVSYHCDSKPSIKKSVLDNILSLSKIKKHFNVNLMMHPLDEYWDECINLVDIFTKEGVYFMPRVINGLEYSKEQSEWLKNYWSNKNKANCVKKNDIQIKNLDKKVDEDNFKPERKMKKDILETVKKIKLNENKKTTVGGRHCCVNSVFSVKYKDTNEIDNPIYLTDTNFKSWFCGVNWFFLHLESQTDSIYLHQTCQATFTGGRGAVGTISNYHEFISYVEEQVIGNSENIIICPNNKCGCGICATKAFNKNDYVTLMKKQIEI